MAVGRDLARSRSRSIAANDVDIVGLIQTLVQIEFSVSTGGFGSVAVAKTRILQGSHLDIAGLSKGKHLFQCCIHPWMRMEVDVK